MTTARTVQTFGAPKENAVPLSDPNKYVSAQEYGRLVDDVAQMTCTTTRAWVRFPTALANGAITPSAGASHMGTSSAQLPAVARTGTGVYTVTYPASWTDNSGILKPDGSVAPGQPEDIVFTDSSGSVRGATAGHVQTSENGSTITVYVFDLAGVASDLGGGVQIRVEGR
jgi:hypothetical protein